MLSDLILVGVLGGAGWQWRAGAVPDATSSPYAAWPVGSRSRAAGLACSSKKPLSPLPAPRCSTSAGWLRPPRGIAGRSFAFIASGEPRHLLRDHEACISGSKPIVPSYLPGCVHPRGVTLHALERE